MLQLLDFLYRRRIFLLFLLLETVSFWLIFNYNQRYNTYFLNSSNRIIGEVSGVINYVQSFLNLQQANKELAEENLSLRKALAAQAGNVTGEIIATDSMPYNLVLAKVVNSSHLRSQNYLTLKIDPSDSIRPGMGVVSAHGVVGTVKSVSKHFATVTSLLHPKLLVSGRVQANGALATIQWDRKTPLETELKYVPRHLKLEVGDSVVTSGFNTVYPEGYVIGVVAKNALKRGNPFYSARIRLTTDFTTIRNVYMVKMKDQLEKKSLEKEVSNE